MLCGQGMHGPGDCLHQRGILRQFVERHDEIWLETSWPQVYHDMPTVRCVAKGTTLRTQLKNIERCRGQFVEAVGASNTIRIRYSPQQVKESGSVLAAMCRSAGVEHSKADFRMPVPQEWVDLAHTFVQTDRPILV